MVPIMSKRSVAELLSYFTSCLILQDYLLTLSSLDYFTTLQALEVL